MSGLQDVWNKFTKFADGNSRIGNSVTLNNAMDRTFLKNNRVPNGPFVIRFYANYSGANSVVIKVDKVYDNRATNNITVDSYNMENGKTMSYSMAMLLRKTVGNDNCLMIKFLKKYVKLRYREGLEGVEAVPWIPKMDDPGSDIYKRSIETSVSYRLYSDLDVFVMNEAVPKTINYLKFFLKFVSNNFEVLAKSFKQNGKISNLLHVEFALSIVLSRIHKAIRCCR